MESSTDDVTVTCEDLLLAVDLVESVRLREQILPAARHLL